MKTAREASEELRHRITAAVVIGELAPRCGPSVNAVRLVRVLAGAGLKMWLFHQTAPGLASQSLCQELREALVALRPTHPLHPGLPYAFARHLACIRPDIVHFNLPTHLLTLAAVAKMAGTATVCTFRNVVEYNARWIGTALRFWGRRFVDRFVAVSQSVADSLAENNVARGPVRVIHNGVEVPTETQLSQWRYETRTRIGIAPEDLVIGTVGRLVPDKRQEVLLEALVGLRAAASRSYFLVVGDGPARPRLEEFCRQHDLNNVIWMGWQEEVYRFLAAMDVFVFHSMPLSEGLPTVVVEAAAAGLPLVLAKIKCLTDVFRDGEEALFAAPGDPDAFACQLAALHDEPGLRKTLGEASRARAVADFSLEATVRNYISLYRELVGGTR